MQEKMYNRIATGCLIVGVGVVLVSEANEVYSWMTVGLAIAITIVAAAAYFAFHMTAGRKEETPNRIEGDAEPVEVAVTSADVEKYREVEYTAPPARVDTQPEFTILVEKLREVEYPFAPTVSGALHWAKLGELEETSQLLGVWTGNLEEMPKQIQKHKLMDEAARAIGAQGIVVLGDGSYYSIAGIAGMRTSWEKWHRHKRGVAKRAGWLEVLTGEGLSEEGQRMKTLQ